VDRVFVGYKQANDSVRMEVLYNILFEYCAAMNMVRLIKLCLNEIYSKVREGKNLSDLFPPTKGLKKGDALTPLLFNFVLE